MTVLKKFSAVLALVACLPFAAPVAAIDIQEVTSPGGIKAWLVESRQNPIIAMQFAFTGGAVHEPVELGGLANLMASTMDEGAGEHSSEAFRKLLDDESISLSFSAGRERLSGSFKTLGDSADLAFDLLRQALNEPRFDDEPVDRIRRQIQAGLQSRANDPSTKSGEVFREMVYGDHPFSRNSDGTVESMEKITPDDLRKFKSAHLGRDGLMVAAVGAISPEELGKRLDQVFGDLPATGETQPVAAVSNQSPGAFRLLEFDQPQSTILFVQDSIKRNDPDFFAAYIVNHILGGGSFSSRLYREVREKRGLTYGVGTSLGGDLKSPLMFASLQTANNTAKEAMELVRAEWQRMAEEGPTREEMDTAVKYVIGSYAMQFTNTTSIANMLLGLQIGGRSKSYPNDRIDLFKALTLDDLKRTAKSLLTEDKLTVIVSGNPEGLTE